MPNLDKTGPAGQGPKTGRTQGRCGNTKSASTLTGPKGQASSRRKKLKDGSGLGKRLNRKQNI